MKKVEPDLSMGIWALPPFPVVLVTVGRNIMTAGAFHFYSFEPPSVVVGIIPRRYTYELIKERGEFGINIPRAEQIELVRTCGSVSGRDAVAARPAAPPSKFDGITPLSTSTNRRFRPGAMGPIAHNGARLHVQGQ